MEETKSAMSANPQKVLIIQDASRELCNITIRKAICTLNLNRGAKVELLGIIQAVGAGAVNMLHPLACVALLRKYKTESSASVNVKKEEIKENIQRRREEYSSSPGIGDILKLAKMQQVEFKIEVEAGPLKEVAVEYARSFEATHIILHRKLKRDQKYLMDNLTCAILRVKKDYSIIKLRGAEADETARASTSCGIWGQLEDAFRNPICSLCMKRRVWIGQAKHFTYAELQLAADGFSSQNLLPDQGKRIYKGLLNNRQQIRIRQHPPATIEEYELLIEAQILARLRHENVAMLLGSCTEGNQRLLVYEYICNGSLNHHLSEKSPELTWHMRINIAYQAAKGLEYLNRNRIYGIARPSNILLTHDFKPLLSYYGFSRNQYEDLDQSSGTRVLRTFDYLPPEYEGPKADLSSADVYSFGVVLLELITGRKTIQDTDGQTYLRWARPLLKERKYMELVDPLIQDSVDLHQLLWMVRLVNKCLCWDPERRYSMNKLVLALANITNCCGIDNFSPTDSELMPSEMR